MLNYLNLELSSQKKWGKRYINDNFDAISLGNRVWYFVSVEFEFLLPNIN